MDIPKRLSGRFVHVIARIDLEERTGKILYVNPATAGVKMAAQGDPAVRLRFTGSDGVELASIHPVLHLASCEAIDARRNALVQEDVELRAGMSTIELQVDDKLVDTYTAAQPAAKAGAKAAKLGATKLQGASPFAGPKIKLDAPVAADQIGAAGVSYTVQARPTQTAAWTTLAVGSKTPNVTVDANQFPGSKSVIVRVLKTNGFSEDVIAEDQVKF